MVSLQRRFPPNSEFARKYYNVYCTWLALSVLGECWNDSSSPLQVRGLVAGREPLLTQIPQEALFLAVPILSFLGLALIIMLFALGYREFRLG